MYVLPADSETLSVLIESRLFETAGKAMTPPLPEAGGVSSVLFLLGENGEGEASLILTKRSLRVSQPGDLCSPGGRVSPVLDRLLAPLLLLPGSPLYRWPRFRALRARDGRQAARIALLSAAALRESWEEIGLNPLSLRILGLLNPQELTLFKRTIHPVCGWGGRLKSLKANSEVESILFLPLRRLLNPRNYAAYTLMHTSEGRGGAPEILKETVCYRHREEGGAEILWGAALWITLQFLKRVFDFVPPPRTDLPEIQGELPAGYYRGN
jgi:8-oxo-dGTP pyrophosphatase MutT (NUDIX family)